MSARRINPDHDRSASPFYGLPKQAKPSAPRMELLRDRAASPYAGLPEQARMAAPQKSPDHLADEAAYRAELEIVEKHEQSAFELAAEIRSSGHHVVGGSKGHELAKIEARIEKRKRIANNHGAALREHRLAHDAETRASVEATFDAMMPMIRDALGGVVIAASKASTLCEVAIRNGWNDSTGLSMIPSAGFVRTAPVQRQAIKVIHRALELPEPDFILVPPPALPPFDPELAEAMAVHRQAADAAEVARKNHTGETAAMRATGKLNHNRANELEAAARAANNLRDRLREAAGPLHRIWRESAAAPVLREASKALLPELRHSAAAISLIGDAIETLQQIARPAGGMLKPIFSPYPAVPSVDIHRAIAQLKTLWSER